MTEGVRNKWGPPPHDYLIRTEPDGTMTLASPSQTQYGCTWRRIHTFPRMPAADLLKAIDLYMTVNGVGKYDVYGAIVIEGDTRDDK